MDKIHKNVFDYPKQYLFVLLLNLLFFLFVLFPLNLIVLILTSSLLFPYFEFENVLIDMPQPY